MCPVGGLAAEAQIECLRNNGAIQQDGTPLSARSVGAAIVVRGFARNNDTRPIGEQRPARWVPAIRRQGSLILCDGQPPWPPTVVDQFVYVTGVLAPNVEQVPVHWYEGAQPFVLWDCTVAVGAREDDVREADRAALVAAQIGTDRPHIGMPVSVQGRAVTTDEGVELHLDSGLRLGLDCPGHRDQGVVLGTLSYTPPLYLVAFPPTDLVKLPGTPYTGTWRLTCDPDAQ